jgi:putative addiction module component (TIGR02574 family)
MGLDLHALADAALGLEPADRLALASLLMESVEAPGGEEWERAWTEELQRRTTAADARQVRGSPWSEVRARLLRELTAR